MNELSINIYLHLCISCFAAKNKTFIMSLSITITHFTISLYLSLTPACLLASHFSSDTKRPPYCHFHPGGMCIAASVIILLDWKCWGQRGKPQSAASLAVTVTSAHGRRKCNPNLNRSQTERAEWGEIERERERWRCKNIYSVFTWRGENILLTLTLQTPCWITTKI